MRPASSSFDSVDVYTADTENLFEVTTRKTANSNFANLLLRKLAVTGSLAVRRVVAAFVDHILRVVCERSKKEVIGSNARRVVAVMKNLYACWYPTKSQNPGRARCVNISRESAPIVSQQVTVMVERAGSDPNPATTVVSENKDLVPKAFWEGWRKAL